MESSTSEQSEEGMDVDEFSSEEDLSEDCDEASEAVDDGAPSKLPADGFPIGAAVSLVGLNKAAFNHHIGTVITAPSQEGRVGVSLHSTVWSNERPGRRRNRAVCDPVSLKPENLRRITLSTPVQTSVLGCVPQWAIHRLLGDTGLGMPWNVAQNVAECLLIHRVQESDIAVTGCSTSRRDFELDAVLDGREDTWWISGAATCRRGIGCEYLEFGFGSTPRRVSFLGMMIPALPHGPLSVRDFHVLALRADAEPQDGAKRQFGEDAWVPVAHKELHTLDRGDLQEFALWPPVETRAMRVVCTKNAAADAHGALGIMADCIGLFQIAFK